MAATIDYPAELPLPLRAGYSINHVSPLMRSELVTGRARQRRKYTSTPTMVNVSWIMTEMQARLFETWFRGALSDGTEWFNVRLRTPVGVQPYECRFAAMYTGPQLVAKGSWQFAAEFEMRERPVLVGDWTILPTFIAQADVFDMAINREWPAST